MCCKKNARCEHRLTIQEAIEHSLKKAKTGFCGTCSAEHAQIAAWLEELVKVREANARR